VAGLKKFPGTDSLVATGQIVVLARKLDERPSSSSATVELQSMRFSLQ
jgi:hypothetical protein